MRRGCPAVLKLIGRGRRRRLRSDILHLKELLCRHLDAVRPDDVGSAGSDRYLHQDVAQHHIELVVLAGAEGSLGDGRLPHVGDLLIKERLVIHFETQMVLSGDDGQRFLQRGLRVVDPRKGDLAGNCRTDGLYPLGLIGRERGRRLWQQLLPPEVGRRRNLDTAGMDDEKGTAGARPPTDS